MADELGDLLIAADLLASAYDLDLGKCVMTKFNKTSVKMGIDVTLDPLMNEWRDEITDEARSGDPILCELNPPSKLVVLVWDPDPRTPHTPWRVHGTTACWVEGEIKRWAPISVQAAAEEIE